MRLDFACGDEVYGSCTQLRDYLEGQGQGYVLRVPSDFRVTLAHEVTLTCAQAVRRLMRDDRRWEVRSAGKGSKGDRWYARAWIGTTSPRHCLLIRRHVRTGELACHYCYVPAGRPAGLTRLIRAAGLRWPAEEDFEFGKESRGFIFAIFLFRLEVRASRLPGLSASTTFAVSGHEATQAPG
ncbi:MAG: hypothetical protein ACLPUO_21170 [Streptosporangiaceae bacterium]